MSRPGPRCLLLVGLLTGLSGCGGCSGPSCDLAAIVSAAAGPGAADCGAVDLWLDEWPTVETSQRCAGAALAAGEPFFVTLDLAVSDGRIAVAYTFDGGSSYRLDYHYAMGFVPPYLDHESIDAVSCTPLIDLGAGCGSLGEDLCFDCRDPVAAPPELTDCGE